MSYNSISSKENQYQELYKKLIFFLTQSKIITGKGEVLSWLNPNNPGYIYPEIMGYYLTFCTQLTRRVDHHEVRTQAHNVAKALCQLSTSTGGIGREKNLYLFDTAVAINGLLLYQTQFNVDLDFIQLSNMIDFVSKLSKARIAIVAADGFNSQKDHWSNAFGASMLKVAIALYRFGELTCKAQYQEMSLEIADEVIEKCFNNGVFQVYGGDTSVYTHANCYALEGLIYLKSKGYMKASKILSSGMECLKMWQNPDGSLFNWHNTNLHKKIKSGDATAQAIRLWLATDKENYSTQIEQGFKYLSSLQSPSFGLYYSSESRDINSWTSMFAFQALDWYLNDVDIDCLI